MAINKKLIHFKTFANFNSLKLSANEANTKYTIGVSNTVYDGSPDILYHSICYIKDRKLLWTHGQLYCDSEELKEELNKIAKRVDENEEVTSNAIFNLQEAIETNELITTEAISDIQENINILDSVIVEFNDNLETQNYIITDIFESIENLDKVVSASLEHINQVIKDNEESVTASMLALNDKIPTKVSLLDNDISYATEKFVADKINKFNFKTINGNSVLGNGDINIPNEIEFINISRKLLDNPPIYAIGEIKAIINSYNTNKLIAIKSSDNLTFGKGWFIPNIRITKQEERYYIIYLSGVIGHYYIEHIISYDSLVGTISATAQSLIDLSERGGSSEDVEDVRYFTDFTVEYFIENCETEGLISNSTMELFNAMKNNKIICVPYEGYDKGFIVASYKSGQDVYYPYMYLEKGGIEYFAYTGDDGNLYGTRPYSQSVTVVEIEGSDETIFECLDNHIYKITGNVNTLIPLVSNLQKGTTIHFMTANSPMLFSDGLLWANGKMPLLEPYVTYELSLIANSFGQINAVLTPFAEVTS